MSIARRSVLKTLLTMLASPLLHLLPGMAAAARPDPAFDADGVEATLRELFGTVDIPESDQIRIEVTGLAEDGSVVPVVIETDLPGVSAISLIATKNPVRLVARFELGHDTNGFVATRIKLAETSEVLAIVETGGALFLARKTVEVILGGCGGES